MEPLQLRVSPTDYPPRPFSSTCAAYKHWEGTNTRWLSRQTKTCFQAVEGLGEANQGGRRKEEQLAQATSEQGREVHGQELEGDFLEEVGKYAKSSSE